MIKRILLALLAAAVVVLATVMIWQGLRANEQAQVARVAESESYASRSRLVRNVDTLIRALRDVHIYWSAFGHLPRDLWADDSSIELSHFEGVELILWTKPGQSLRFARTAANPVFDHRPDEKEWSQYKALLEKSESLDRDRLMGPYTTAGGRVQKELYLVPDGERVDGTLIAIIDTQKALARLMKEDSPGFAITVKAKGTVLYQRGEPAVGIPEEWTRTGMIETPMGTVWEVTHSPTEELARTMHTPAIDAVLYAGIAIAALIGLLLLETGRASDRARVATLAQKELGILNRELEAQVAERTRDLEERSRDLVTIADSVGHDLRNPLNSISTNVQLLEQQFETHLGNDGLDITRKLYSGVGQMTEILDRLLSLSTVSNVEFQRERLDMKEMVEEINEELSIAEPGTSVDFFAEDVPDALAEPVMVQTLLFNLLSNAYKYSRSKPDRKIIFGFQAAGKGPAWFIQDNGVGFDEAFSERMFSAFERLQGTNESDGLGLGLDIANRVVRRHEGRIWAEGKPGVGATFYFTLGEEGFVA